MEWDRSFTRWVSSLAGQIGFLDGIMRGVTAGGPLVLVALIGLRWWSTEQRVRQRNLALVCGLATALALLLNQAILIFYQRVRPYEVSLTHLPTERSTYLSFPSDHATVGFAISFSLLMAKDRWGWAFLFMTFLMSVSRIYVGTHYLSDILGGGVTGGVAAIVVAHFYSKFKPVSDRLVRIL